MTFSFKNSAMDNAKYLISFSDRGLHDEFDQQVNSGINYYSDRYHELTTRSLHDSLYGLLVDFYHGDRKDELLDQLMSFVEAPAVFVGYKGRPSVRKCATGQGSDNIHRRRGMKSNSAQDTGYDANGIPLDDVITSASPKRRNAAFAFKSKKNYELASMVLANSNSKKDAAFILEMSYAKFNGIVNGRAGMFTKTESAIARKFLAGRTINKPEFTKQRSKQAAKDATVKVNVNTPSSTALITKGDLVIRNTHTINLGGSSVVIGGGETLRDAMMVHDRTGINQIQNEFKNKLSPNDLNRLLTMVMQQCNNRGDIIELLGAN